VILAPPTGEMVNYTCHQATEAKQKTKHIQQVFFMDCRLCYCLL